MILGGESNKKIILREVMSQWASRTLSWDEQGGVGNLISGMSEPQDNGYVSFDVTQFIKKCVFDRSSMRESVGFAMLLDAENEEPVFIATSDNTSYPPYLRITLNEAPDQFFVRDNINEVD
jgi:hypothetical protein